MGLFDKKYCDFCGEKIGLLGNRKLKDGNMCKNCAKLISSLITDRKEWTVSEMKEHLDYRQENYELIKTLRVDGRIGRDNDKLFINTEEKLWFVSPYTNYADANPDVFSFSQVRGCEYECRESRSEIYYRDANGHNVSYNPREYDYDYDFYVTVYIDSPITDRIVLKLNSSRVDDVDCVEYHELGKDMEDMKYVFDNMPRADATGSRLDIPGTFYLDDRTRSRLILERRDRERYIRERRMDYERRARNAYNNGRR